MNNSKIISLKRFSAVFLAIVLVTGTIAMSSSFITNAQAQPNPNGMDYNNYQKYKDSSKKSVNLNKIKCINTNININGNNSGNISIGNKGSTEGYLGTYSSGGSGYGSEGYYDDGYGNIKQSKGFDDCIINNNNTNTNIISGEGNQTVPPEPTTTPATLTVNKEIFGCNIFSTTVMNCQSLQNDDPRWILCDDPAISNTPFCQKLTEDLFDIEVLDDQGSQIAQFEGSAQGTTIDNLEPGTYTVNEIEATTFNFNQLLENSLIESLCNNQGFPDGGFLRLNNTDSIFTSYEICFEYEDEQGNDCSTITLAAGEEKTCTVKNYIRVSNDIPR